MNLELGAMPLRPLLRRGRNLLAICTVAAVAIVAGCNKTETSSTATTSPATGAAPATGGTMTVGFIYVGGKDDYGYNQAHHEGAQAVAKMPGVKILEMEN